MTVRTSSQNIPRLPRSGSAGLGRQGGPSAHRPGLLGLLALSLSTGCASGELEHSGKSPGDHAPGLARFSSCSDMRAYMVDAWTETLVQSRYGGGYGWATDDVALEDGSAGGESGAPEGPSDWSETNVQEAGVDEPDIVKTDGDHIYVVHQDRLTVLQSWPAADTAVLGSVDLPGAPISMFLEGDRAVVFSYDWQWDGFYEGYGYGDTLLMSVVDVSDRTRPEVTREVRLEGYLADARMVDGHVYTVIQSWTEMPHELWDLAWQRHVGLPEWRSSWSEARLREMRQRARSIFRPLVSEAVAAIPVADLLPAMADGLPGEEPDASPLLACTDVYRPHHTSSPNTLSMVHLELGTEGAVSATGLMADGWEVYASQDHLVVSQASWAWWWGEDAPDVTTHLHQFSLEGDASVYEGSGAVPGWLLNNYSLSEHDGHLRVATSDAGWWGTEDDAPPANNVFVLENTGSSLDVVGRVRGIAPGETIQSARFMGDKGYLVTFEQIDPLFTLDLSDPTDPRVVGELKVPGFSTYLHPFGDDHILSVGYDGTMEGEITGMAVNLFDISNFAEPVLADQLTFASDDWSWSEALWDAHAFTFHRGVLSLPLYTYGWDAATGEYDDFSGMLVVDVDADTGLHELGRVDHADLVAESRCVYDLDRAVPCDDDWWYAQLRRSVVIEDNLYSISDYGVKVTALEDPSTEHATVLFWPL